MDDDGYVNIVGRIKDMVIRGGENIYPREIEEFLYTHPDIVDVQVIGVPDERYGEELMAWVHLRHGVDALTAEDAARVLRGHARPLQDPPLRARRRRLPDDRHRQDPQGRDAGAVRLLARPRGRGSAGTRAVPRRAAGFPSRRAAGCAHGSGFLTRSARCARHRLARPAGTRSALRPARWLTSLRSVRTHRGSAARRAHRARTQGRHGNSAIWCLRGEHVFV